MLIAFCGISMADDTYTVVGTNLGDGTDLTWDADNTYGDMTLSSGTTYTKTFKGVRFTSAKKFAFKVIKNHGFDGEGHGSWPKDNYTHDFNPGVYDITVTFDSSNGDVGYSDLGRNYIVYSVDNFTTHTVGNLMDYEDGVHTGTITGNDGYRFVIIPSWDLNSTQTAISSWSHSICPPDGSNYDLYFQHMSGGTKTNNNQKWYIKETATYTITYNGSKNTFETDAEKTVSINSAAGWATFSSGIADLGQGYTVTGGDAYYISSKGVDKAILTHIAAGAKIPTYPTGIMLKKIGGGDVIIKTTASSDVTLTDNMLQGSGRYTNWNLNNDGYIGYYLNNGSNGLGFYPANTGNMSPYKAFFRVPNSSGSRTFFSFGEDDETTGLEAVDVNPETVKEGVREYYNLNGQRVMNPTKGLYIVNGKKVIIK